MTETATRESAPEQPPERSVGRRILSGITEGNAAVVNLLALVVALVVAALLIAIGDPETRASAHYFTAAPVDTFRNAFSAIWTAYKALFEGAIFNPASASNGTLNGVFGPLSETLTVAAPLILAGLSVGLAFRAGLFNIGAQGMMIMGVIVAAYVGFHWHLPAGLHLILAVLGGILAGAIWGALVGWLKASTGAHEVITTIMLNYVALNFLGFLLSVQGFQRPPYGQAISNVVDSSARYPHLLGSSMRVNLDILVALAAAWLVWWLLERSTIGFQLRAVGANQNAARTAGMNVARTYVVAMALAGALAGLAGTAQILGTNPAVTNDIDAGIGFDGITVALLGRAKPGGTVLAGLLFGALRAGGVLMQSRTGTPVDLVTVVQALIVLFIAAPALIRAIFRLRAVRGGVSTELAKGWNG
ncbi:MAG: ABC transporter permease [Actinomycetales bacterium]